MNSQNDKEGSGHVKAAVIGGVFALIAACVGGAFLLLNTMVNNGVIVFGASNPSDPISSPTTTTQSLQTNFPDITVSAKANNGVQFIAPASGNYKFTIKDSIYCTPSICRSIIHGYLGRDIVWKDFYGLPHPMEQDYEIGCWENPTASNKDCAVGMSITVNMNAQQYIKWVIMEDKNAFADNTGAVILKVTVTP